jgi:hypothetical protein
MVDCVLLDLEPQCHKVFVQRILTLNGNRAVADQQQRKDRSGNPEPNTHV